jgi:hypothetical protein
VVEHCPNCETSRSFSILTQHVLPFAGPPEEYTFAKCDTCDIPCVFLREDMGDGFEHDGYWRMFPAQARHLTFAIPAIVRTSYEEAQKCEIAHAWIACAAMVGRALEAVCRDFDPTIKTMFAALKAMLDQGVISQELYDWANQLRVIRNYAAHAAGGQVSESDAKEGFDFLQSILEIYYDLRPRFAKMKARQQGGAGPLPGGTP